MECLEYKQASNLVLKPAKVPSPLPAHVWPATYSKEGRVSPAALVRPRNGPI